MKKQHVLILAVLGSVTLVACSSKTDANEKNFSVALSEYLDKKGESLCIRYERWPVDVDLNDAKQEGKSKQMAALEAVGLVEAEDAEIKKPYTYPDEMIKIKRYTLTDAAQPFNPQKGEFSKGHELLCWGKKAFDKVVKWDGPKKDMVGYTVAYVTYTYKINTADWAKNLEVQAAFPAMRSELDKAGKEHDVDLIKLTRRGWKAPNMLEGGDELM